MKNHSIFLFLFLFALSIHAQTTLPYTQDFEGAAFLPSGWQRFGSNAMADWEHSTTVGAYGNSSGSAFFDNFTTNLSGNFYGMRAVILDLSTAVNPTLKFDVAYARRNGTTTDRLGIWYSFDGTSGWMNLQNFEGNGLATAPDQNIYFTPTAEQWDSITIDLTQFAGESLIRFAFENNSSFGNVIYIDNVRFFDAQFVGIGSILKEEVVVKLYPNPAKETVQIEAKGRKITEIRFFDTLGKRHATYPAYDKERLYLSLQGLSPGVYFVQIDLENAGPEVRRIVVQ